MQNPLLAPLFSADSDARFSQLLRIHGPITDGEIEPIATQAQSDSPIAQRNAVRLLCLNRSSSALHALRSIAMSTSDETLYALALDGILSHDREDLARVARRDLLNKALVANEPAARATALLFLAKTHPQQAQAAVDQSFADPDQRVQDAALRVAIQLAPGRYRERFSEQLLRTQSRTSLPDLYAALSQMDDPRLADVFLRSFALPPKERSIDFHNALLTIKQPLPWLKNLLLQLLPNGDDLADAAFDLLDRWGGSESVLCSTCLAALEKAPAASSLDYRAYMINREQCRGFLGKLAARPPYTWEERSAALTFAQQYLKAHPIH